MFIPSALLLQTGSQAILPAAGDGLTATSSRSQVVGCGARPKTLPFSPILQVDTNTGQQRVLASTSPFEAADTHTCSQTSLLVTRTTTGKQALANYSLSTGALVENPLILNHSHQAGGATSWTVDGLRAFHGQLFGIVFQGGFGWIHGVLSIGIDGQMRQLATIPMNVDILIDSVTRWSILLHRDG